jgi:hypothetical protein
VIFNHNELLFPIENENQRSLYATSRSKLPAYLYLDG